MKLQAGLLLPAFVGAASALLDATVYILQGEEWPKTSGSLATLNPEQARLVFAQRLGVSQYHGLGDASEDTLSYINVYGGPRESLFNSLPGDKAVELVMVVEGSSDKTKSALDAWSSFKPAFMIAGPPSMEANKKLVQDLNLQAGQTGKECALDTAINPYDLSCWGGKSKAIHLDLESDVGRNVDFFDIQSRLTKFVKKEEMNVVIVFMPATTRASKSSSNPYGIYEKVVQVLNGRRDVTEEPMTDVDSTSSPTLRNKKVQDTNPTGKYRPITGIAPLCYTTLDTCVSQTNDCSGHGECYNNTRRGGGEGACFSCACQPTRRNFTYADGAKKAFDIDYWGGGACQKKDVSGPFWLIAISSIILMGLVGWAIGLIFSIGEEKLPGVIGAGVSSKTR